MAPPSVVWNICQRILASDGKHARFQTAHVRCLNNQTVVRFDEQATKWRRVQDGTMNGYKGRAYQCTCGLFVQVYVPLHLWVEARLA